MNEIEHHHPTVDKIVIGGDSRSLRQSSIYPHPSSIPKNTQVLLTTNISSYSNGLRVRTTFMKGKPCTIIECVLTYVRDAG